MAALWHSPLYAREHFGAVEACYVLLTAGSPPHLAVTGEDVPDLLDGAMTNRSGNLTWR